MTKYQLEVAEDQFGIAEYWFDLFKDQFGTPKYHFVRANYQPDVSLKLPNVSLNTPKISLK